MDSIRFCPRFSFALRLNCLGFGQEIKRNSVNEPKKGRLDKSLRSITLLLISTVNHRTRSGLCSKCQCIVDERLMCIVGLLCLSWLLLLLLVFVSLFRYCCCNFMLTLHFILYVQLDFEFPFSVFFSLLVFVFVFVCVCSCSLQRVIILMQFEIIVCCLIAVQLFMITRILGAKEKPNSNVATTEKTKRKLKAHTEIAHQKVHE